MESYKLEIHFDVENDHDAICVSDAIMDLLNGFEFIVAPPTGFNLLHFQRARKTPWRIIKEWRKNI